MRRYESAAVCHTGKKRTYNEDNLFFNRFILKENHIGINGCLMMDPRPAEPGELFGIFDGMGGLSKGELASYIMAEEAGKAFYPGVTMPEGPGGFMAELCFKANERVCQIMKTEGGRIGTTASMLFLSRDQAYVCNIGDSPIYLFRQGQLQEVYMEHTDRKLREKLYGKEAVVGKKFPLSQHIGILSSEMIIDPYTADFPVVRGDYLLLCSDGLTDMVDDQTITKILQETVPLPEMIGTLRDTALDKGGRDNITIILIRIM